MEDDKKPKPKPGGVWNAVKPVVSGVLSTSLTLPLDMIKVRIQLGQGSAAQVTSNIIKNEGVTAFYKGLSAGLLKLALHSTARFVSFKILENKAIEANNGKPLSIYQKFHCGLTANVIGTFVGSPAGLALVRMQADATLPAAQRRNYSNAFHALDRIVADEGGVGLLKGAGPNVVRFVACNMGMLVTYGQAFHFFRDSLGHDETVAALGSFAVCGCSGVAFSLPFDYVKTQIQTMQPDAEGKYPYTGSIDCAIKTFKSGGPLKFYTGFAVCCLRNAPLLVMSLIFQLRMQELENRFSLEARINHERKVN